MNAPDDNLDTLADAIGAGSRRALAQAITLVESTRPDHRVEAEELLRLILPLRKPSLRLGISGSPGVGKSTFIEAFGLHLIEAGETVAVLAVDPSSKRTGGSILGDKTRMERLSKEGKAFIRPSPSGGGLGGVARRTREAMHLVEAAGYSVVIVETVGVGQSETTVAEMVDMFMLLLSPGGGDELQGIKRGIMELADLIIVNKADGEFIKAARHAAADYRNALHLIRPRFNEWTPEVTLVSSINKHGMDDVWDAAMRYHEAIKATGAFEDRRAGQATRWMWSEVEESLLSALKNDPAAGALALDLEADVANGALSPAIAAKRVLAEFLKN